MIFINTFKGNTCKYFDEIDFYGFLHSYSQIVLRNIKIFPKSKISSLLEECIHNRIQIVLLDHLTSTVQYTRLTV